MREKVLEQAKNLNPDGTEKDDGMYHGQNAYIDYRKGFRRAATAAAAPPRARAGANMRGGGPAGESTTWARRRGRAPTARCERRPTCGSPS